MKQYPHLISRLFNTPLLIHPDKLTAIISGLGDRFGTELAEPAASPVTALREESAVNRIGNYQINNGIAVLDVVGVLAHRTTLKADSSMVLGYERVGQSFQNALADPAVKAILLNVDSPGGEVAGAFELGDQIYQARGQKPIIAYASPLMTSAAYLIASAADSISYSDTSIIGSIGVVMMHADFSGAMEKAGITIKHLFAGARKVDGNPYEPLSEEVAARLQADIDHYYQLFVQAVARNRPRLSVDAVRATDAAFYIGATAQRAGLADKRETISQTTNRLRHVRQPVKGVIMESEEVTTVPQFLGASAIAERCIAAGEPALGRALLNSQLTEEQLTTRIADAGQIRKMAQAAKLAHEADPLIQAGISVDQARQLLWAKGVERSESQVIDNALPAMCRVTVDSRDKFRAGITDGLLIRAGLSKNDGENTYRRLSLKEVAAESLRRQGEDLRGYSTDMAMVKAAITHTTSDFPVILENVLNRTLLDAYSIASDTWRQWCAVGSVSDFKSYKRLRLGSFSNLDALGEGGEYKHKAIPDGEAEIVSISTKANTITLTRQAIINDDLGAFTRLGQMMARSAARSIESDAYTLLLSNPTLDGDSTALFHANHSNYHTTSDAAAISMTSLDAARALIKQQKDRGGRDYLGISEPFILLCPVAKAGAARAANESAFDPDTANKLQRTNISRGILSAIVDTPYLTGTGWYLFASPQQYPTFEVLFLNGNQTPYTEQNTHTNVDGVQWLIRLDYGVNVVDYVGAYYNTGA